jgi:hypothetical protein
MNPRKSCFFFTPFETNYTSIFLLTAAIWTQDKTENRKTSKTASDTHDWNNNKEMLYQIATKYISNGLTVQPPVLSSIYWSGKGEKTTQNVTFIKAISPNGGNERRPQAFIALNNCFNGLFCDDDSS